MPVEYPPGEWLWALMVVLARELGATEFDKAMGEVAEAFPAYYATGQTDLVAIVTATCSDRTVVAGDVTLTDRASGTSHTLDLREVDVTWQAFVPSGALVVAGQRELATVVATLLTSTGFAADDFAIGPIEQHALGPGRDQRRRRADKQTRPIGRHDAVVRAGADLYAP